MTTNIGTIDRTLRILVGFALVATALGLLGSDYHSVWGWIGVIPIASGLVGLCPLYAILSVGTCKFEPVVDDR
ncbi:MAG: DUF2892 domain-containing protein [Hyphomicrobium sp.]